MGKELEKNEKYKRAYSLCGTIKEEWEEGGGGLKKIGRENINMGEEDGAEKWGSREGTVRVGEGTLQQKTGINMEEEEETLA